MSNLPPSQSTGPVNRQPSTDNREPLTVTGNRAAGAPYPSPANRLPTTINRNPLGVRVAGCGLLLSGSVFRLPGLPVTVSGWRLSERLTVVGIRRRKKAAALVFKAQTTTKTGASKGWDVIY